jgi:hypothetical protein
LVLIAAGKMRKVIECKKAANNVGWKGMVGCGAKVNQRGNYGHQAIYTGKTGGRSKKGIWTDRYH